MIKVAYFVRKVKKVAVSLRIPLDNGGIIVYNNMAKLWENYAPVKKSKTEERLNLAYNAGRRAAPIKERIGF